MASTNSGDNWDLIGDVPGTTGTLPDFVGEDHGDLMARIRKNYDEGVGAWEENRRMHSEDLNFIYNSEAMGQWDPVVLQNRRGKPCYTFNRVIGPVNIVVSDMRQTRPSGKVRPMSDAASGPVAEIYEGLCRSIELASRADQIYKEQYKYAVAGGFGFWRIMPTYMEDDGENAFDQVLRIINVANPQTVVLDPQCADACGGDANYAMVAERISNEIYEQLYKDENGVSFTISRDSYGWFTDKEVRIAEYFERVPFQKKIAKLIDGRVIDWDSEAQKVEANLEAHGVKHGRVAMDRNGKKMIRETTDWKVMWVKVDGSNVLEGPYYYDWKRIPIVRCPGRYVNIEGRKKFQSLVRHAKDAQRSYNSRASDMIERSALLPKAPYLVTEAMIKGYENEWAQANVQSRPYLPYNVDPKAPEAGMPFRVQPLDLPQGAIALAQMSIQDIQSTIGMFDPALGNAEEMNRVSGKALVQHTRRSDLGTFEFVDGYEAALQLTWEMMIDMIPTVYDAKRVIKIVGKDDVDQEVKINHPNNANPSQLINDLTKGSYGVTVTVGPSFQTARQEALQTLIEAAEVMPQIAQVAPDLFAKNLDVPEAQEMARRLRIPLLQQGLVQPTEAEKAAGPPKPSPAQLLQQQNQQAQAALLKARADKMGADAQIAQSRASVSPLERNKVQYEVAGKHLANIKLAHEIGANQAEAASDQASAQQDLAQGAAQHQQDMQQQAQQGQQDMQQKQVEHMQGVQQQNLTYATEHHRAQHQHRQEMARADEAHRNEMSRLAEKHDQAMKHANEQNEMKIKLAKAMAAAKPKPAKKPS